MHHVGVTFCLFGEKKYALSCFHSNDLQNKTGLFVNCSIYL